MKRVVTTIFYFLFLGLLTAFSQSGSRNNDKSISDGPTISFSEIEYDFGTLKSGDKAVHYFVFSNNGKSPLAISNVRTSCGCTVPKWPKKPIAAEGKDSLKVEYNTSVKGTFNKTITVQSNALNGEIVLRIRGEVVKSK